MAGSKHRTDMAKHQTLPLDVNAGGSYAHQRTHAQSTRCDDLRARLDELRKVDGCPRGESAALLALAEPPYYTPCPNPYLFEFLAESSRESNGPRSISEAYSLDVAHVRAGPVYNAHSYPTKVPPEAIAQYILHYTKPGDVVLDFFAGTGMTGIAAQMCGHPSAELRDIASTAHREPNWGLRRAVLCDLSPLATFISACLNLGVDPDRFVTHAKELLAHVEDELGWIYEVPHDGRKGTLNYVIWSEVFACPHCSGRLQFWSVAIDRKNGGIRRSFPCPHCDGEVSKSALTRLTETVLDPVLSAPVERIVRIPALLNYTCGEHRYEREPTAEDLEILDRAAALTPSASVPACKMMFCDGAWGDLYRAGYHTGITHVHHFYFPRSLVVLGRLWELAEQAPADVVRVLKFFVSSYNITHATLMTRVIYKQGNPKPVLTGYQTGALYISSLPVEKNVLLGLRNSKLQAMRKAFRSFRHAPGAVAISTQSATSLDLPAESIDYVFVDPPFGDNIQYAEGNFIAEAWLGCFTNQHPEAIVSSSQGKDVEDYRALIESAFRKAFDALKPGRWMTVQFHNSQNRIWNAVQEAIVGAGFVVADVSTLDKKQGSFKQVTTRGAVKQDLIISAYKPDGGVQARFDLEQGTEGGVWAFVQGHLEKVAKPSLANGSIEVIPERMRHLLFDRMVAFHVLRGVLVPVNAAQFYAGLGQRYPERDGMYFLPDQVAEYDRLRSRASSVQQLSLFVSDEITAIHWLQQELRKKPQTYQELHPTFMQSLQGWDRHERPLELRDLLDENFLRYDGASPVPSQIHSYLSTNFKDLRNLDKNDPALKAKARDRWYVPDPSKEGDLEKLRLRTLLKEFEDYRASTSRKLKQFRTEAVRAGFKHCYDSQDYQTIVDVAAKLPEQVIQEDEKLLMYFDVATMRLGQE